MIFWAFLARAPVRATVNKLDDVRVLNLTKLLKMNDCGSGHHPAAGKLKYLHLKTSEIVLIKKDFLFWRHKQNKLMRGAFIFGSLKKAPTSRARCRDSDR
jgi:hypothetical protein